MDIQVIGVNHTTAPIEVRERLSFPRDRLSDALLALKRCDCVEEDIILSTCNRTEIYAAVRDGAAGFDSITRFLSGSRDLCPEAISSYLYRFSGREAVRHLFRVASSLDSMIVGETQIFGQVKDAYFEARRINASGKNLNSLFEEAIKIGKRVRTETGIGKGAVSVSTAAIELARKIFESLEGKSVLIIGAGKIGEMTVKNLYSRGISTVVVANRTFEKAGELAKVFNGRAIRFDEIGEALAGADIVISSTSAPHFVIGCQEAAEALRRRGNRQLFLIDLGLPRNIDPKVNSIGNAYVYNIDDLAQVRDANIKDRMNEAAKAEKIIETHIETSLRKLRGLCTAP